MNAVIGIDARTAEATPSGLGTYARHFVRAVTAMDTNHSYVIIRRAGSGPPIATGRHVSEVIIPGDQGSPNLGHRISRLGLDLYHSLHPYLPIGLRAPRIVATLHDLIWIEHRRLTGGGPIGRLAGAVSHVYAKAAVSKTIRRADQLIAISEFTRSRVLAYFGMDPSRVAVVHLGVELSDFPPALPAPSGAPALPGLPGPPALPAPYFLCLGNSRPYKNLGAALQAFALLVQDRPEARLVVTGRGDRTSELRKLSDRLGIEGQVTFTGLVDQARVLELLHGAVALVFPSLIEGFGLPVLEAMAAGCPVVASNCETMVEVGGDAALFCDPLRPEEFAAAMARLMDDDGLRADVRRRGMERAAAFSWNACARRTLDVYERLLVSAPVGAGQS